jgi:hypothetical protein
MSEANIARRGKQQRVKYEFQCCWNALANPMDARGGIGIGEKTSCIDRWSPVERRQGHCRCDLLKTY